MNKRKNHEQKSEPINRNAKNKAFFFFVFKNPEKNLPREENKKQKPTETLNECRQ